MNHSQTLQDHNRAAWENLAITRPSPLIPIPSGTADDPVALLTIAELIRDHSDPGPAVVEGLVRRGEVMNVIGPPKARKSWFVHDLALAVATGMPFLGRFNTVQGRVLLIDNELHRPTLSSRFSTLLNAYGISPESLGTHLVVKPLRGRLVDLNGLRQELDGLEAEEFSLVILDAMYRFFPEGTNESDNAHVTRIYNTLDGYAAKMGAAVVCVHHTSKGNQSAKGVTDVGSGAGAQSRAADTHLVIREHEQEGAASVHAVVRSWKPVEPFVIAWEYPRWRLDEEADPAAMKAEGGGGKTDPTPEEFVDDCVPPGPAITREEITRHATDAGYSKRCVGRLLKAAVPDLLKRYDYGGNVAARYGRVT